MRSNRIVPMLGLVVAFQTVSATGSTPTGRTEPRPADRLRARYATGRFHYVGGDRERIEMQNAILRVVAQMSPFARPFARKRLMAKNPIYPFVMFHFPPNEIAVTLGARSPFVSPDNGEPRQARAPSGEDLRVTQRFVGGHLVQELATRQGSRRDVFMLSPDAKRLVMDVTLESPQLPDAIHYQLTYRK